MTILSFTRLGGAVLPRPSGTPLVDSPTLSVIAGVGGLVALLDPAQPAESPAPLSLPDLVDRRRRWNAANTGESPALGAIAGRPAVAFDGSNDSLDMIDINTGAAAPILPVGSYSVLAVVQPLSLAATASILGGVSGSGTWSRLDVSTSGTLGGFHGGGAGGPSSGLDRISAGETALCALSYDTATDTLAVMLNGVVGSTVQSAPAELTNRTLQVGNHAVEEFQPFDGLIGDVLVLDWALHAPANAARATVMHAALADKWGVSLS